MALSGIGFGSGSQKSKSVANSQAENFSTSISNAGGISGSQSSSAGGSQSYGVSQDQIAFSDLYQKLYGDASQAAGNLQGNPFLSDTANKLFTQGNQLFAGLNNDAGTKYLQDALTSNEGVDEQISLLGGDINKFLQESALPGLRRSSAAAGQLGGSRQSVGEGIAISDATRSFATGAANIRNQNRTNQFNAAGQLAGNSLAGVQIGGNLSQQLYGLAEQGFLSNLSPSAALSQILGGPTTLGSSLQQASSFDEAISNAFSEDFAKSESSSYGYDVSQATSTSKGKNKSFSLGF